MYAASRVRYSVCSQKIHLWVLTGVSLCLDMLEGKFRLKSGTAFGIFRIAKPRFFRAVKAVKRRD